MMRPEVWSNNRITIIEVVDLPQPTHRPARRSRMSHSETDAVDRAELFGFDRRLAAKQFGQHHRRALARIFLDELVDEQKGFCRGGALVETSPRA